MTRACSRSHAPLLGRHGASTYSCVDISARRDAARSHANSSSLTPLLSAASKSVAGDVGAHASSFTLCSYMTSMNVMNRRIRSTRSMVIRGTRDRPTV